MEVLKLDNRNTTLVDSVEESLIRFKEAFHLKDVEAGQYSPLVLAYIGDAGARAAAFPTKSNWPHRWASGVRSCAKR